MERNESDHRRGRWVDERQVDTLGTGRGLDLDPRSAYELLTRQMVTTLAEELREIRQRVNGLILVVIGAVITDVILRLVH